MTEGLGGRMKIFKSVLFIIGFIFATSVLAAGSASENHHFANNNYFIQKTGGGTLPPFPWANTEPCEASVVDLTGYWQAIDPKGNTLFYVQISTVKSAEGIQIVLRQLEPSLIKKGEYTQTGSGTGFISEDGSTVVAVMVSSYQKTENRVWNWVYIHSLCMVDSSNRHTVIEYVHDETGASRKFVLKKIVPKAK